jgi:hypothetical protein
MQANAREATMPVFDDPAEYRLSVEGNDLTRAEGGQQVSSSHPVMSTPFATAQTSVLKTSETTRGRGKSEHSCVPAFEVQIRNDHECNRND